MFGTGCYILVITEWMTAEPHWRNSMVGKSSESIKSNFDHDRDIFKTMYVVITSADNMLPGQIIETFIPQHTKELTPTTWSDSNLWEDWKTTELSIPGQPQQPFEWDRMDMINEHSHNEEQVNRILTKSRTVESDTLMTSDSQGRKVLLLLDMKMVDNHMNSSTGEDLKHVKQINLNNPDDTDIPPIFHYKMHNGRQTNITVMQNIMKYAQDPLEDTMEHVKGRINEFLDQIEIETPTMLRSGQIVDGDMMKYIHVTMGHKIALKTIIQWMVQNP